MDEDSSSAREETKAHSSPVPIRLVAFLMDLILLVFLEMLIIFYLPKFLGEESELNHLLSRFAELLQEREPDQGEVQRWWNAFYLFLDKINFNFFVTLTFLLYFLLGELFCKGKSIGKATFSLMTVNAIEVSPPNFRQVLIRSLLKGLSAKFFLLGLVNFLFCIFNRDKRCLHDLASGTITVRSSPRSQDHTTTTQKS
jgi:uncharacterized RDD family membrane protein YckC